MYLLLKTSACSEHDPDGLALIEVTQCLVVTIKERLSMVRKFRAMPDFPDCVWWYDHSPAWYESDADDLEDYGDVTDELDEQGFVLLDELPDGLENFLEDSDRSVDPCMMKFYVNDSDPGEFRWFGYLKHSSVEVSTARLTLAVFGEVANVA